MDPPNLPSFLRAGQRQLISLLWTSPHSIHGQGISSQKAQGLPGRCGGVRTSSEGCPVTSTNFWNLALAPRSQLWGEQRLPSPSTHSLLSPQLSSRVGSAPVARNASSHRTQAWLQLDLPGLPVPREARLEDGRLAFPAACSYSIRPFLSKGQL